MIEAWVENELGSVNLGDPRRNRRVKQTVQTFWNRPNASIPEASESVSEMQAIYDLVSAGTTRVEAIREAHAEAVVRRVSGCEEILIAQDSTELSFNTLRSTEGLGPLSGRYSLGLMMHTALVIDPAGVPQGVLHQATWARDAEGGKRQSRRERRIEEKESQKWLTTVRVCEERLPESMKAWIIGDSEADIYELMAMPRRAGIELLIRATHNRRVHAAEGLEYVWEAAAAAPVTGRIEVELKRTRLRKARTAELEVRLCPDVQILRPKHKQKNTAVEAVSVSVVLVREVGEVPPEEKPVEWLLVSTKRLASHEEALSAVRAYVERWKVERYHYTLKSGCQVEKLQLEHADRLKRAVTLYSIVAWRLLLITYLARTSPDLPCTTALDEEETEVLHRMANPGKRRPAQVASLREAVRQIARLGGFLGRKGDGEPGVKVLRRGLRRLADFVLAYRTLRAPTCD
ncbi:MAG TPA: IS4 family transposase [Longimicrobiaceae bacterium]|jgi:hypothetical protein|nr:IS4 family transposase [Longimicrobiaceae bacterium]